MTRSQRDAASQRVKRLHKPSTQELACDWRSLPSWELAKCFTRWTKPASRALAGVDVLGSRCSGPTAPSVIPPPPLTTQPRVLPARQAPSLVCRIGCRAYKMRITPSRSLTTQRLTCLTGQVQPKQLHRCAVHSRRRMAVHIHTPHPGTPWGPYVALDWLFTRFGRHLYECTTRRAASPKPTSKSFSS